MSLIHCPAPDASESPGPHGPRGLESLLRHQPTPRDSQPSIPSRENRCLEAPAPASGAARRSGPGSHETGKEPGRRHAAHVVFDEVAITLEEHLIAPRNPEPLLETDQRRLDPYLAQLGFHGHPRTAPEGDEEIRLVPSAVAERV